MKWKIYLIACTLNFLKLLHVLRKLKKCVRERTCLKNNQVQKFAKFMISNTLSLHVHDKGCTIYSQVSMYGVHFIGDNVREKEGLSIMSDCLFYKNLQKLVSVKLWAWPENSSPPFLQNLEWIPMSG